MPASRIVLDMMGVSHSFEEKYVLHDVNLAISRGEIVGLVGPSGCGKSTLLNMVVGILQPMAGKVVIASVDGVRKSVRGPGRDRGIVYQNYDLFEFLTVAENVAFGLMLDQTSLPFRAFRPFAWRKLKREHEARARALLERVGLSDAIKKYPSQLSGGMRQRVAVAQALIMEPEILLLDEPFGALDEATREELQRMLLRIYAENVTALHTGDHRRLRTMLIVTHELTEAIFVSDRVMGLSQYWDWRRAGYASCPGATIVYDKPAPVFAPEHLKRPEEFAAQREEIYRAVFSPEACHHRDEFVRFWEEVQAGRGRGVLAS